MACIVLACFLSGPAVCGQKTASFRPGWRDWRFQMGWGLFSFMKILHTRSIGQSQISPKKAKILNMEKTKCDEG